MDTTIPGGTLVFRARALLATGLTVREAAARVKVGKTALYEAWANLGTAPSS